MNSLLAFLTRTFSTLTTFLKARSLWQYALVALLIAGGAYAWFGWYKAEALVKYKTAKIDKGNVVASVSASGTINPVSSVSVGSQVSGQMQAVLADFNTEVKANQVIARIDPEIFEYRVRQAQADLDSARAQLLVAQSTVSARRADQSRAEVNLIESKSDAQRKQSLFDKAFISSAERDKSASLVKTQNEDLKTAVAQIEVARAQVSSAQSTVAQRQAGLDSARADLAKTVIRSPVDGIVIKRSIEVGQTVAASLQAPELFVIAKNLRDMQVDTAIDESDIGKVRQGMKATFTVDSFPGRTFNGEVTQVRKAAQTVQNVVTYTVVVGFSNAEGESGAAAKPQDAATAPNKPTQAKAGTSTTPASTTAGSTTATAPATSASPAAGGAGGGQRAARERMETELAMSDAQKQQLGDIYTGMRDKFMALRDMDEAARAAASASIRTEMQGKIAAILTPAQLPKFKAMSAEQDAKRVANQGVASQGANAAKSKGNANGKTTASSSAQSPVRVALNPATLLLPGMTANVRLITAEKNEVLRVPMAALRFKPAADKDAEPAKKADAAGSSASTAGAAGAGGAGGAGGALRAAREKLEATIVPTEAQKKQLDDIYAAMRDKFSTLRDLPEADRPKASAAARADVQSKIMAILTPEQKPKYEALLAEAAAARASGGGGGAGGAGGRGKVYILDENGKPKGIDVRTGVSDGSLTELILTGAAAEALKEGAELIVGTQNPNAGKPASTDRKSVV